MELITTVKSFVVIHKPFTIVNYIGVSYSKSAYDAFSYVMAT